MLTRFLAYGKDKKLFNQGSRLLLAVSGGLDSMVMAWLFREAGTSHAIAHCNFSLRGEESDSDEAFVNDWAREADIPFHVIRFETLTYSASKKISVQMAARVLRYNWFRTLVHNEGFDGVAIAHNLNDNVETFLINLMRGTGLGGLTGMSQQSDKVIRPLLFASREEISSFAALKNIAFREDSSNKELKYTRNRIRHKILPEMAKVSPGVLSAVTVTMDHLSSASDLLEIYLSQLHSEIFRPSGETTEAVIKTLMSLTPLEPHIFELFRRYGIYPRQTSEIIALLHSETGKSVYTSSHRLLNDRGRIIITPITDTLPEEQIFKSLDEMRISGLFHDLRLTVPAEWSASFNTLTASLDLGLINFPLMVRSWQPGDRFMPLGMRQMKKISDFLIDLKVPVTEKERVLVLLSGKKIMWVMGYRIDDRFKVTRETEKILVLTL